MSFNNKSNAYNQDQLSFIIHQIQDHRDKAMIDLIANTGLYLDELKILTLEQIKDNQIHIKGKRPRYLKVPDSTKTNLNNWLKNRPKTTHNYLFTSVTGQQQPLSSRGIDHILRKWSSKINIDMNYQKLRNSFNHRVSPEKHKAKKQIHISTKQLGIGLVLISSVIKCLVCLRKK